MLPRPIQRLCPGACAMLFWPLLLGTPIPGVWGVPLGTCTLTCEAAAEPASGEAPLSVQFTGTTETSGCLGEVAYQWSFGDGAHSSEPSPLHEYAAADAYFWEMTASIDGHFCTAQGTVVVTDPSCEIQCLAEAVPEAGDVPLLVQFTPDVQTQNCSGTPQYYWEFGDGTVSTLESPSHLYETPGLYPWVVQVWQDGAACSASGTVGASSPGCTVGCEASADPSQGTAPLSVRFEAVAELDGCPGAPTFLWAFGDGTVSLEKDPVHLYASAGDYGWDLAVEAAGVVCERDGTVSVSPPSCTVSCDAAAAPSSGSAPLTVRFSPGLSSEHCIGDPSFAWEFGDGAFSDEAFPLHVYPLPGVYGWSLEILLDEVSAVCSGLVEVIDAGTCILECAAEAAPAQGPAPLEVGFAASLEHEGCQEAPSAAWDFGDGQVAEGLDAMHRYEAPGEFAWSFASSADGVDCEKGGWIRVTDRLPGDCDGGGAVSLGEVQGAVNMFLGVAVPGCGVDADGSGGVSLGEVQRVINAFLLG